MAADALIAEMIEILTSGIVGIGQAFGEGISTIINYIFFVTPEGGTEQLSTLAIFILIFAAISLALSLFRLLLLWISSFGSRHL